MIMSSKMEKKPPQSLDIFLDKWGIFEKSPAVFCNSVTEFSATMVAAKRSI
jgi:hypothetical protein